MRLFHVLKRGLHRYVVVVLGFPAFQQLTVIVLPRVEVAAIVVFVFFPDGRNQRRCFPIKTEGRFPGGPFKQLLIFPEEVRLYGA